MDRQLDFFLGAPSPTGFSGYYQRLLHEESAAYTALLKGTPGCGKSTLLHRTAALLCERGYTVECIHCSADKDSLDAVLCREASVAVADATPPHKLEPLYPVAREEILSLYDALDRAALTEHKQEIITLFEREKTLRERASRYLAAAGSLLGDTARAAQCFTDLTKARTLAKALSRRYIPTALTSAREEVRLLSAVTGDGVSVFAETVPKLADTCIVLEDAFGCAGKVMLGVLRCEAMAKGHAVISCYCSLSPYEKLEHLFIPALRLAFLTSNPYHPLRFDNQRTIHCERFCDKEGIRLRRQRTRFNKKATLALLAQASALQREALTCHRELEQYYVSAMDFAAAEKIFARVSAQIDTPS